jgi:hypothetical protein
MFNFPVFKVFVFFFKVLSPMALKQISLRGASYVSGEMDQRQKMRAPSNGNGKDARFVIRLRCWS